MKIAMMVRSLFTTPVPKDIGYSPSTIAQTLAEGLQSLGHEITFFGPEGTALNVSRIETCGMQPIVTSQKELDDFLASPDLFQHYKLANSDAVMAKAMMQRANDGEYDCVVFHHFETAMSIASMYPDIPVVHILHDFLDSSREELIRRNASANQHFISISNNQQRNAPDVNYLSTIYNGVNIEKFDYNPEPSDYLFFSGRITHDKGVREAIQVAKATRRQLLIAGPMVKADYAYFDEHVKPYLDDNILFLGLLEKDQLIKYYQRAYALLVPIQWEEPFGLTMIEANACGTPVIAFRRGAVPEIIQDSKNGFIVDNTAEMILAVKQIRTLSRKKCREHVTRLFTNEHMIKAYEKTLSDLISTKSSSTKKTKTEASKNK
jgi:glycosyltransferase involved in cell wall biosynthesis